MTSLTTIPSTPSGDTFSPGMGPCMFGTVKPTWGQPHVSRCKWWEWHVQLWCNSLDFKFDDVSCQSFWHVQCHIWKRDGYDQKHTGVLTVSWLEVSQLLVFNAQPTGTVISRRFDCRTFYTSYHTVKSTLVLLSTSLSLKVADCVEGLAVKHLPPQ